MKRKILVVVSVLALLAFAASCGQPVSKKESKKESKKTEAVKKNEKTAAKTPSGPPAFNFKKFNLQRPRDRRKANPNDVYKVPVPSYSPVYGGKPNEALVTLVEFSEFQCPFCGRVIDTIHKLEKEYGNKIRVVFRHNPLPFHKHAQMMDFAGIVVYKLGGNDAFWKFHDIVFPAQREWSRLDEAAVTHKVIEYVKKAGVDVNQFKQMMENPPKELIEWMQNDVNDAAKFGANGTPNFFINGKNLVGAQPYERFKSVIDKAMKEAEQYKGKPDIYAEVVKNGKTEAAAPPPPAVDKTVYKIEVPKHAFSKGAKNPKVVIIEFSDFQCPFSKRVQPTLDKLVETYPKDVVRYYANNPLPFHKNAMIMAVAAMAAGDQGKFWEMHKQIFDKQSEWGKLSGDDLKNKIVEMAKAAGVKDVNKIKAAIDNPGKYEKIIKEQQEYGRKFGARGTPTVFINGRRAAGALPYGSFENAVKEEIAKAEALLKKGVKAKNLYKELIKNGKDKFEQPQRNQQGNQTYNFKPSELKGSPMKGDPKAPVTIVEFSDFQCPFCGRVEGTLHKLMQDYKGKIKLYWKHLPLGFHKFAKITAVASIAAHEQGKFWEYHDKLYDNQREWSRAASEDEVKQKLIEYAKELKLNMKKFEAALNNPSAYDSIINKDVQLAQKAIGPRYGTPTFFINGKKFVGAQPYDNFKKEIEAALSKKK